MHPFTQVRQSLRAWLAPYRWIQSVLPYHLYIMLGGVGAMLLNDLFIYGLDEYVRVISILSTIGYWAFLFGMLLTLISASTQYLSYALWAYVLHVLIPFEYFTFGTVLRAAVYVALGVLAYQYYTKEKQ
ncbi:hypothetical protein [Marinicrinis lubricantis]|uniref:Uncharacterized protein n=1 Tax=Marinicrinis lubricantis TaxID=2086470 RepID=A0ABW1IS51_9BACL